MKTIFLTEMSHLKFGIRENLLTGLQRYRGQGGPVVLDPPSGNRDYARQLQEGSLAYRGMGRKIGDVHGE